MDPLNLVYSLLTAAGVFYVATTLSKPPVKQEALVPIPVKNQPR